MPTRPTFYILDAFSLIFQVFHAIRGPSPAYDRSRPDSRPRPSSGSSATCSTCCATRKPDYLAAAFDGPGPVFRSEIYAEYKANPQGDARRPGPPDSR